MTDPPLPERTREIYEQHAAAWDQHRHKALIERRWLDRLLAASVPALPILDVGCGAGEPIARYLIESGRSVHGIDFAEAMLELSRARFPAQRWTRADMRTLDLTETYGAVVAWDSFFHLTQPEQRACLPRLARHVAPGGGLLFTCGPQAGEVTGTVEGDAVFHASLDPHEYEELLAAEGLRVEAFVPEDPTCDLHTVCLARRA